MKQNVLSVWKFLFTHLKIKWIDLSEPCMEKSCFLLLKSWFFLTYNGSEIIGWILFRTQPQCMS